MNNIKTYYFKRGNPYERKDTIQNGQWAPGGDVAVCTYWAGVDISVIQDMLRHIETSDPSIGRDQSDEYGIYYNA
jgi:hypothetical protein